MRKTFFYGSIGFFCLLSSLEIRGEGIYRGSGGVMAFVSGVESAESLSESEQRKELQVVEILRDICQELGIEESLFEGITDSLKFCECLRECVVQEKLKTSKDLEIIKEELSDSKPSLLRDPVIIDSGAKEYYEESVISEQVMKGVLDALEECTKSLQIKEEKESILERRELELREKELAFKQEQLAWKKEKAEKELAWKKEQYIRDLVKH